MTRARLFPAISHTTHQSSVRQIPHIGANSHLITLPVGHQPWGLASKRRRLQQQAVRMRRRQRTPERRDILPSLPQALRRRAGLACVD